jgi:hypothetical protein
MPLNDDTIPLSSAPPFALIVSPIDRIERCMVDPFSSSDGK